MNTSTETQNDAITFFGLWVYLMTDLILFAALFAVFIVLRAGMYGGTPLGDIFSAPFVLEETLILLTSSFTAGLSLIAARANKKNLVLAGLIGTAALGAVFLGLELSEFSRLVAEGHSWQTNGALSAYFTLVGTHGLHIAVGLIWGVALIASIARRGLMRSNLRKLLFWSSFWHFLDLVWIFIFTIVYLQSFI